MAQSRSGVFLGAVMVTSVVVNGASSAASGSNGDYKVWDGYVKYLC